MLEGRPPVFSNFISHLDEVTELPPGAVVLAGNDFSQVQAMEVRHGKGYLLGSAVSSGVRFA